MINICEFLFKIKDIFSYMFMYNIIVSINDVIKGEYLNCQINYKTRG